MDDPLKMKDHQDVCEALKDLNLSHCVDLGGALGLSHNTCRKFSNVGDLVASWLRREDNVLRKSGEPTWNTLADVLEKIGQTGISRDITCRYVAAEYSVVQIDAGTRKRSSSVIRTLPLSPEAKENLRQRIHRETQIMKYKFSDLQTMIRENLNVSPKALATHVIGMYILSEEHEVRMIKASSIEDIFIILTKYWSFLDFGHLENIAGKYCSMDCDAKRELEQYKEEVQQFCTRRVSELPQGSLNNGNDIEGMDKLIVTLDLKDPSLRHVLDLKEIIANILGKPASKLVLCDIGSGSVVVIFWIATSLGKELFLKKPDIFTQEQRDRLKDAHVVSLEFKEVSVYKVCQKANEDYYVFGPLGMMEDNDDDSFGEVFGQRHPPLSIYIKGILERYPDGQIFKEMIQNADDAGATIVQFFVDARNHATDTLVNKKLKAFQGPALISANNAVFSEEDWEGIQKPQQSIKADDPFKVGRFGIGFNSVYHITGLQMTQTVMRKIKRQFALLQVEVRSAMEARQVKLKDIHQFLVSFFQSECCIRKPSDLTELFNIVTESGLWRYDHYGPLAELAEAFLPDNKDPARKLVSKYKDQLSGFFITTKIVDFIDLSDFDDSEDDSDANSEHEDDNQQPFSPKESKKLFRKLKVKLRIDRTTKFSDLTMSYVETLWTALIEEFNLPPLMAIIKKIVSGSLIITWLVPLQVSSAIAVSYSNALGFYQQHNIVQVQLDGRTLYDEEWITGDINNALIDACEAGCIEKVTVLLDLGADMNYQDEIGQSALWWASYAGRTKCVKVLLKYGAQVDLPDEDGDTPLIKVCRGGHIETARVLVEHGADVDQQNNGGETALNLACYGGESEIVSLLLKAGARTDIQEERGETALFWAADRGDIVIVQMLVDHGAAVDLGRSEYGNGLMMASRRGSTETMSVLLAAKADPNVTDGYGDTALHEAGKVEIINLLVKHGAAVDTRNKYGDTALHDAAARGKVEAVKALIDCGAAVDVRNEEGLTAMEVARGAGEEAVCEVLEQYQQTRTELTEEQRESVYQRLLKMLERTFLKEQVKKREEHQKKEHHRPREERIGGERKKRSLWNRLRRRQDRPRQIIGTAPAPEK